MGNILQLYNELLVIEYSPMAALHRTYALPRANGKAEAIAEAERINLTGNHLYDALLGEPYDGVDMKKHFFICSKLSTDTVDKRKENHFK